MTESDRKRAEKIGAYAEQGNVRIQNLYVDQREERAQLNSIPQNVPMRGATKFVGRETELATIHQEMQTSDRVIISAIAGMGGVGKTELAIRYAVRNAEAYPGGICWLNGTQADLFEQVVTFARTVLSLKLPPELEKSLTTIEQQFIWYREYWQPSGAVLLIVDDVAEMKTLRSLLQYLPPRFKVLLTTRRKRLDADFVEMPLDVLPLDKAIELLAKLIGSDRVEAERATAEDLCEWLGRLPLGVELIGRYVAPKPFLSLVDLKAQVEFQHRSLEDRDPNYAMTAQQGVRAAFELSWQELGDAAMAMGRFLSLFAAAEIGCELVQRVTEALGWVTETMEEAREQLAIRHLLQEVTLTGFRLHPLMREFFALKLNESENGEEVRSVYVKALVEASFKIPYPLTQDKVQQFTPLIPHLDEIAQNKIHLVFDGYIRLLFFFLGWFYEGQELYSSAQFWYEKGIATVSKRLGKEHLDYCASLGSLAKLHHKQELNNEARSLYQEASQIIKNHYGEDHPNYAVSLNHLAESCRRQESYDEAKLFYQEASQITKNHYGEDHPNYAVSLHGLAEVYRLQKRYDHAELLYQKASQIIKNHYGENNSQYASIRHNLSLLYDQQELYTQSELLLKQSLQIERGQSGENHSEYAIALCGLALLYISQKQYPEAELLLHQCLQIQQTNFSETNSKSVIMLNSLALLYKLQGRYRDAELLYLKVRDLRKQVLGEEHPSYLTTLHNLAGLYDTPIILSKLWKTTDLARRSVKISISVLGRTHPATRHRTRKLWRILLIDLTLGLLVLFFASHLLIVRSPIALLQFLFALFLAVLLLR